MLCYRKHDNNTITQLKMSNDKANNVINNYTIANCAFTRNDKWFRYRAAAIIIENDNVLFATNEKDDIYYSIGGAVHIGETAEEAVTREVYEETGVHYEIDHLAVIHENFFQNNTGMLKGLQCHEITLYFMMKSIGSKVLNSNSYVLDTKVNYIKENTIWLPINDLNKYKTYPKFMKQYLQSKHNGIKHIVSKY